jgi:integrase
MPRYRRGSGHTYQRGNSWWLSYYYRGAKVREAAKFEDGTRAKTAAQARRILQIRVGEIAGGEFGGPQAERVTFDDLAAALVRDYEINGRRSLRQLRIRIERHLRPAFGGRRACQLTAADLASYIEQRLAGGASNAEINREMAALKRAFHLALQEGRITRLPPFKTKLPENNVRRGFFERWQLDALLARLPDYLRAPITFAYWFGWRFQSEILPLTWDQVDVAEGSVRLWPNTTKNGEGRIVYLAGEQLALFRQLAAAHETLYPCCNLVFHRHGRPIKDLRAAWARACCEAGLGGRIPHDFRRTAVRNLVRCGIADSVAMKITGHKTRDVFGRYDIVSDGDLRRAANRMLLETGTLSGTVAASQEPEVVLKH